MTNTTKECEYCGDLFAPKRSTARFCKTSCRVNSNKGSTKRKPKESKPCANPTCDEITSGAKYHSHECRKAHTQARTKRRNWNNFLDSNFGLWIASTCKRSGTVEILQGWNKSTVEQMRNLKRTQFYANGIGHGNRFQFAHLSPVNGTGKVGLFNPRNLMLVDGSTNQKLGDTDYGHIEFVNAEDTSSKWDVPKTLSTRKVLMLADKYLKGLFKHVAQVKPFAPRSKSAASREPLIDHEAIVDIESLRLASITRDAALANEIRPAWEKVYLQPTQLNDDGYYYDPDIGSFIDEWGFEADADYNADGDYITYAYKDLELSILTNDFKDFHG